MRGSNQRLVLLATILGSAVVFVDTTVVNVALPALRADLNAGLAGQQWVVEAYLLTLASLVLIGGSLGDVLGRRRVFAIGVGGFGATSLLCAAAPTIGWLIAGRALQGVFGALLVPSSLAIIAATFQGEARGAAIGTWTAATSAMIAVGPPLGGLLIDATSWRAVFAINVPLVAICLVLIARSVPSFAGRPQRVDYVGAVLCALGLGGPVFALIEQPTRGWGDPAVVISLVGGLALLAAFFAWERRTSHPMLPVSLFAVRNFAVANAATLAVYAGLGSATFFLVLFLQQVAGYSALAAGAALTPITVAILTLSRLWGRLNERLGPRRFMTAGPLICAAGLLLLLRISAHPAYFADVLPGVAVFGLGLSLVVAPLTSTVLAAVDESNAGIASGVNNAVARVAGLLAIAIVGAVVASRFGGVLDDRLAGVSLSAADRGTVATLRDRPLAPAPQAAPSVRAAAQDASVSGFEAGMLLSAALVACGGAVSFAGLDGRVSV